MSRMLAIAALLFFLRSASPAQGRPVDAPLYVSPLVIGETFTIPSSVLHEVRRTNVYLPAGYSDSAARLPVLYMPDGGTGEDFIHVFKPATTK